MKKLYLIIQLLYYCCYKITTVQTQNGNKYTALTKPINLFGYSLYKTVYSKMTENFVISPFNTYTMMSMIYLGAQGNAAKQLRKLLQFKLGDEQLQYEFASYLSRLTKTNTNNDMEFTHLMFINDRLKYNSNYQSMLSKFFSSDIIRNNFINETKWINSIISERTNSKIRSVVSQGTMTNSSTVLLTDAMYFSGSWLQPFSKENTVPKKFYIKKKLDVKVMTMHSTAKFKMLKSKKPKCDILELPYENQFSMYIILPPKEIDIKKFEKSLPKSVFENIVNNKGFKESLIKVHLPTFFMSSRLEMKYHIKKLGARDIFDPNLNNFSRILIGPMFPYVNKVVQKSVIKCEEGESDRSFNVHSFGCQKSFKIDRPFIFVVVDKLAKLMLLMGRIINPRVRFFYGPI